MNDKKTDRTSKESDAPEVQIPLAELIGTRYNKVRELRENKIEPYPYRYDWTHYINQALADYDKLAEPETVIRITGRIMLKRKMGKVFFADVRDSSDRLQIYVRRDDVEVDRFQLFNTLDLGDIVGCQGVLFITRTGEKTLRVDSFELLTKALHPLPGARREKG